MNCVFLRDETSDTVPRLTAESLAALQRTLASADCKEASMVTCQSGKDDCRSICAALQSSENSSAVPLLADSQNRFRSTASSWEQTTSTRIPETCDDCEPFHSMPFTEAPRHVPIVQNDSETCVYPLVSSVGAMYKALEPLAPWPLVGCKAVEQPLQAALELPVSGCAAADKLEQALRADPSAEVRKAAATTLGNMLHSRSSACRCSIALSTALGSEPDASVRLAIASALRCSSGEGAADAGAALLLAFHSDPNADVRCVAGKSLRILDEMAPHPEEFGTGHLNAQSDDVSSCAEAFLHPALSDYDIID